MAAGSNPQAPIPLLTSSKLRELLTSITGPREKLDDVVELALVRIADDLAMEVSAAAAQLASYRRSNAVEYKDVLYAAEHQFGMTGVRADVEAQMAKSMGGMGDSATDSEGASPPKRGRRATSITRGGSRRTSTR